MTELYRHIGQFTDVPAGDIGVGGREIGYMFGAFKRITGRFEGTLTGKGLSFGGSLIRPEATGYGLVYFLKEMLESVGDKLKGKRVIVSGSGNVSWGCMQKLVQLGAIPVTCSDSKGVLLFESGITMRHVDAINQLKMEHRKPLSEFNANFADLQPGVYIEGKSVWDISIAAEIALPCATQNEIDGSQVPLMLKNGVQYVAEGANMPSTRSAIEAYMKAGIMYGPGKAANAGGVSVSGLEMTQNSTRLSWTKEKADQKLQRIMKQIFEAAHIQATKYQVPLYQGANIAGFVKVADAMLAQGL
jgi:glutamate dehydrogenase (NADP+)